MRAMQSFLIFFYILDQCYEQCQENDLGGFLGAISPEIWKDGQPIDKSIFNDWEKISNPPAINRQNIVRKTYDFLKYYEEEFGFKFTETKQWLSMLNDQTVVENAILRSQEMYKKFNYTN